MWPSIAFQLRDKPPADLIKPFVWPNYHDCTKFLVPYGVIAKKQQLIEELLP